jgi:CubicO group peptidase (beta-lactamase class C family)
MVDTGFFLSAAQAARLPGYYMTDFSTEEMTESPFSGAETWTTPPAFASGSAGLASTVDDLLAFARMLRDGGVHGGTRLLSERSVTLMTTNHLTPEQVATAGPLLGGKGWGLGMAVTASTPRRYGWDGGYGTTWFNEAETGLIAIGFTQVSDFLWGGGLADFAEKAAA